MTDKTPDRLDSEKKDDNGPKNGKESPSPEYNENPDDLRDKNDFLGWLDESYKVSRRSKQVENRRRTTIVDSGIKRELADIIGKGQWVEVPTPEQINQMQSTTPAALKYLIDLVSPSSVGSSLSASPSTTPSTSTPLSPTEQPVQFDKTLRSTMEARRLFMDSVAEFEENQLKFALIVIVVLIILIHMFISLLNSD